MRGPFSVGYTIIMCVFDLRQGQLALGSSPLADMASLLLRGSDSTEFATRLAFQPLVSPDTVRIPKP
jgi:hypothetical protein